MGGRLLHPPMTAVIIVCLSDRPALTSQEGNEPASQTAGLQKQIQTALCPDAPFTSNCREKFGAKLLICHLVGKVCFHHSIKAQGPFKLNDSCYDCYERQIRCFSTKHSMLWVQTYLKCVFTMWLVSYFCALKTLQRSGLRTLDECCHWCSFSAQANFSINFSIS